MRSKDIAQEIADHFGQPVIIRKVKGNPGTYTQKNYSMILQNPTMQQTLDNGLAETPKQAYEHKPLEDSMQVELKKLRKRPKASIRRPEDAVNFMRHMEDYDRERTKILHLDTKNQIVGVENISTGSLNASIVHPREALKGAILNNSAAVIFLHNHPSGNPEPSNADWEVHGRLKEAFKTADIDLLDSIEIGKDGYRSS
jgi:DNA repair protein RadC